jgi:hypothetical protein
VSSWIPFSPFKNNFVANAFISPFNTQAINAY